MCGYADDGEQSKRLILHRGDNGQRETKLERRNDGRIRCLDFLRSTTLLLAFARLVRQELWCNVWHNTTLTDDDVAEELVQPNDHHSL